MSIRRILSFLLIGIISGCVISPTSQRIDDIPMYGQPEIERPEALKKADEEFIEKATAGFGSREKASLAWFAEAEKYMAEGNLHYAMRRYNQAWLLDQESAFPYWGFGRVLMQRQQFRKAIDYFEKALNKIEESPERNGLLSDTGTAYSIYAYEIQKSKNTESINYFKKANTLFEESTSKASDIGQIWARWAHSLYREGRYDESVEKIKKAKSLGAKNTEHFENNLKKKVKY